MTAEKEKCGFTSFLPMSCRGRAEAFARRLHSRLRSLGTDDEGSSADENSWLAGHEAPVAVAQPRHSSESELHFGFGLLESPGSPEEEIVETELTKLITNHKDNLQLSHSEVCHCPKAKESFPLSANILAATVQHDSDSSDGPYFDPDSDSDIKGLNHVNGASHSGDSESEDEENHISESYMELEENSQSTVPPQSLSLSDDESTLSLKDDDCSLEYSSTVQELPQNCYETEPLLEDYSMANGHNEECNEETYCSRLLVDKDLTVQYPISQGNEEYSNCDFVVEEESKVDDADERIPRVRRCSSLKTGKTPPGTPGRKKIVRFADVLGLDLADVRTFLDEIPKVPHSAYNDLRNVDLGVSASEISISTAYPPNNFVDTGNKVEKVLLPLFQQPGGQPNFLDTVRERSVCLENAMVEDPVQLSVAGMEHHSRYVLRKVLHSCLAMNVCRLLYISCVCSPDGTINCNKISEDMVGSQLMHTAIQEYVTQSLDKSNSTMHNSNSKPHETDTKSKSDVLTVFVILLFSVLFMYLQKAIYFMT